MEHEGLGHSPMMFFRLSCPWPFLGQMVPMSCMCKEVNRNSEFIQMNRDKESVLKLQQDFKLQMLTFGKRVGRRKPGQPSKQWKEAF